jgi:hypothetical protein
MGPFDLVLWAIGIGIAWVMLTSLTGLDDSLKKLFGKRNSTAALEEKVDALEKRVAQLEGKSSSTPAAK